MNYLRSLKSRFPDVSIIPPVIQLIIIVGLVLLFPLMRSVLGQFVDLEALNPLAFLPVIAAAWLFGWRGGLLSSLLLIGLGALVLNLTGEGTGWDAVLQTSSGTLGPVVLVILGFLFGRMRDLGRQVGRELHSRLQAEEVIRQMEARLQTVVANSPLILFTLDDKGVFTLSEGKSLERLGLSSGQAVGLSAMDLYAEYPAISEGLSRALDGEAASWMAEIDGIIFETLTNPIKDENGRVISVIGVGIDVTEQQQARKALEESEKRYRIMAESALSASQFKSELLAKVSHELRTPLGVILGYAELVQDGVYGPVTEEQVGILDEVVNKTAYLTSLVEELIQQARLESGKVQLHNNPFRPAELLQQIEAQMSKLARAKELTLTISVDAELPMIITGDQLRLHQILINLVGNAIKFTESGQVQVRLIRPDADHWTICVTDTGKGIPEEALEYIFEPFRQVENSYTRTHDGTGLGLSLVMQLVTLMGGQITVESEVGKGSTFEVTLPLNPRDD